MTIFEFGHLITKAKIEYGEDFKQFVNPSSKSEYTAVGDPIIRTLVAGTVIQIERKGFFRVDKPYSSVNTANGIIIKPAVLFAIPDGKQKAGK